MIKEKEPFELTEHLGTGGFAQTWRACVIDHDLIEEWGVEEVAIKIPLTKQKERVLKREVEHNAFLHMKLTEMESLNIVKYLGFEIFKKQLVMVLKYVSGGSLRQRVGNIGRWKRMELSKSILIAEGILKGLAVIHRNHIMHRDIKPENILMEGDTPKIADLGIGRMLISNELASTTTGTLFYMAPEILFETGASFNADLWSFGITFYEMLCGEFPFGINGKMPPGKITNLIGDTNAKIKFPIAANVPQPLQDIIAKILIKDPNQRYKTAEEILKDLRAFHERVDDAARQELSLLQEILHDPAQALIAEGRLKDLLRRFPAAPCVYLHLGEFYNRCGNYDKAIDIFQKGIEKDTNDALLHWGLAIAYEKKGNDKSAIVSLERAITLGLESSLERYANLLLKTFKNKVK